ncbi:MAG: hypothetical protein MI794_00335 [Pseudomonadales bacterium]|nr:hypothetical protein [Pseudomonadales bacterium]
MHATQSSQHSATNRADIARQLLAANESYRDSNNPRWSLTLRLEARAECRQKLEALLTEVPEQPAALGLLGRVAMDEGDYDQAQVLFNRSLDLDDQQPQQYTNLGYWALATERPVLAEQYFIEALELDRQSAAAFCGIAHAKRTRGQYDLAFLHYRKLLATGLEWPSIYSGMLACAEHLAVDKADPELIRDATALLRRDELPHQQIGRFVGAIIREHYQLTAEDTRIDLDVASQDELLVLALEQTLMPEPSVEELVTLLRRAILTEVAHTAELPEQRQRLAMAITLYADRCGHALAAEDDELRLITAINDSITGQLVMAESLESVAGSLIISAMYGALFHQRFAMELGRWSLMDWPVATQPMMAASYYDRATEEAIKQNFEEKAEELCLDKPDVPQAWPSWSQLAYRNQTSLRTLIAKELGQPTEHLPDTLRIMILGAESGQRALELAHYLEDVEVVAVDESLANIAKASRRAEELGMTNVVFWPWSIARCFIDDGQTVQWIEIGRLPSPAMTDVNLADVVRRASHAGSVVHLHTAVAEQTPGDRQIRRLIDEHELQPTRNNLLRLRRMVLNNRQDPIWRELLNEADFYGLGGCRDRWFSPQDPQQLKRLISLMSSEVSWKLVKAKDSDGHSLATAPVQQQLQAEALGNEVQSLMGQTLSVYFVKRR